MKLIHLAIVMALTASCSRAEFEGETSTLNSVPNQPSSVAPPDGAIRQGSFVAWTEPSDPMPKQPYVIIIQVHYSGTTTQFSESDLSGIVKGTDGYRQYIVAPSFGSIATPSSPIFSKTEYGQRVKVFVPGSYRLIRDTIQVHSQILSESQNIEIIF